MTRCSALTWNATSFMASGTTSSNQTQRQLDTFIYLQRLTETKPPMPQLNPEIEKQCDIQRQAFARRHIQRQHAFTLIWPLVCRRLEGRPNMNATELFDELRAH